MNALMGLRGVGLPILLFALTACGGGGGGEGGRVPSNLPRVTITPDVVNVSGDAGVSSTPRGTISLTVTNLPEEGLVVGYGYDRSFIKSASFEQTGETTGSILLTFEDPAIIGPGTYTGSVEVEVCLDEECLKHIAGSPRIVGVQYTVTGTLLPRPTLVVPTPSIAVEGLSFSVASPTASFEYRIENGTGANFFVSATHSSNGISSVFRTGSGSASSGTFQIGLKVPSQLGAGVYNDIITLNATCNSGCPRGIAGVPQTVSVRYTVSDTLSGPQGFTIRLVRLIVNDITWSPAQQKIYASVPSRSSEHANSIAVIDPRTGLIETSSFAGSEPEVLAASEDGRYLYVGFGASNSIRRKTLPDLAQDILIPIPSDPIYGALFANDIQVAPGRPETIAVARRSSSNFSRTAAGVGVFDNAVQRPQTTGGSGSQALNWLQWRDVNTLYASTSENTSFAISTVGIDANGARITHTQNNVGQSFAFGRIHLANGALYSDGGDAYDPVGRVLIGRFLPTQSGFSRGTFADSVRNKLLMLSSGSGGVTIRSYNLTTFSQIASVPLVLPLTRRWSRVRNRGRSCGSDQRTLRHQCLELKRTHT